MIELIEIDTCAVEGVQIGLIDTLSFHLKNVSKPVSRHLQYFIIIFSQKRGFGSLLLLYHIV